MNRYAILSIIAAILITIAGCSEDEVTDPDSGGNKPLITIISPADGKLYLAGDTVSFACSGIDDSGANLPDSMLIWESDHDDSIGAGTSFDIDNLSVNTHLITCTGTDSQGRSSTESITVAIIEDYGLVMVPPTSGYPMGWDGGLDDQAPVHNVSLNEFLIGKYEVTYALWNEVKVWAESNGYTFANAGQRGACGYEPCMNSDQHPVTMINRKDCIAWCNAYSEKEGLTPVYYNSSAKTTVYRNASTGGTLNSDCVDWYAIGFRLPTEAEWEYAARYMEGDTVSSGGQHSGYNLFPDINDCAWTSLNSVMSTHPVGLLQPNSLGAYDMSGNIWECCWDWYDDDYYDVSPAENPHGPAGGTFCIFRGGTWTGGTTNCRTASRGRGYPAIAANTIGLRICLGTLNP